MAREEMIEHIQFIKSCAPISIFHVDTDVLDTIIEILKQEPSTDAVSRHDVIKAVDMHTKDDGTLDDDISCILEDLPPVTPTRLTGYWIDVAERDPWYRCSECRERVWGGHHKYCPNCGVKMEVR